MKLKNWKHALALGLALAIVLTTGVLNSGNWLHANEDAATTAPAQEPAVTEQPVQGNTVTEQIALETKPAEAPKPTEATAATEATGATEATAATEATGATEATAATEVTEATEATEATEVTEATEATEAGETVLPEAELPVTVTLVDAEDKPVGEGTWTGTLHFAQGEATASVTLPAVEGYHTPQLTLERKAEDTQLTAKAVYTPVTAEEKTLENALNPNRSVSVRLVTDAKTLRFGDTVKLAATLSGYDNVNYTLQWRYSVDGKTWHDCPNQTGAEMTVVVSESNYRYYWNVLVTITGLK